MHQYSDNGEPVIIAHRGYSSEAPENTLAAFEAALDAGAHVLECDVHLSADGQVIVIHDETVDRTTDGAGAIASLTLAELKRLDAGAKSSRRGQHRFEALRLLTLSELIEFVNGRARLLIELKWSSVCLWPPQLVRYAALAGHVHGAVVAANAEAWCVAQSFCSSYLWELHQLGSKMELHQLAFPWDFAVDFSGVPSFVSAINIHWSRCTRSFVRAAHACGWRVHAYNVDDERTMRACLESGADGLITNHVTVGLAALAMVKSSWHRNSGSQVSRGICCRGRRRLHAATLGCTPLELQAVPVAAGLDFVP